MAQADGWGATAARWAAVEAGNDIRTALIGFGADASHAQERTHRDSLQALAELTVAYMLSEPVARRDRKSMGSLEGFTVSVGQPDNRMQEWSPVQVSSSTP